MLEKWENTQVMWDCRLEMWESTPAQNNREEIVVEHGKLGISFSRDKMSQKDSLLRTGDVGLYAGEVGEYA